eukprot:TRINITY_DN11898_c0_g1_i1.p1 TRINITY_DN11898_c0_g1~~TRINITY_DN11898_c0_g1_i1.p1  ORF type:complete len:787 (+),score=234.21 TRINITY_DN11898_c0_g1_i1:202-2562(+)
MRSSMTQPVIHRNHSLLLSKQKTCSGNDIGYDKEHLYNELLTTKKMANKLKDENVKLKTKARREAQEAKKRTNQLKELMLKVEGTESGGLTSSKGRIETVLELELKRQVKALRKALTQMESKYLGIKRSVRATKLQELTSEVRAFSSECERLRKMGKELSSKKTAFTAEDMAAIEERMYKQSVTISRLKQENDRLNNIINVRDKEISELKAKIEKMLQKNAKLQETRKVMVKQKKTISDNTKTIQSLKEQLTFLKVDPKDNEFSTYKTRIAELLRTQSELRETLEVKERELRRVKAKKNRPASNNATKRSKWRSLEDKAITGDQPVGMSNQNSALSFTQVNRKVARVNLEQVKWVLVELRLCFRIAEIELGELREKVFRLLEPEEKISIYELVKIFKRQPLNLTNKNVQLLARYLIEPKDKPEIEYNELAELYLHEIETQLIALIGTNYKLWTEEYKQTLKQSVEEKLANSPPNTGSLEQPAIAAETIEQVLKPANLTPEELEYILLKPYEDSRDMNKLSPAGLVDYVNALTNKQQSSPNYTTKQEIQAMTEDQIIYTAQRCFYEIAQKMLAKGFNVHSLYKHKMIYKEIDGETVELLTQNDFVEGIQTLEVESIKPLEYACLMQVIAINDGEEYVRVQDFVKILEDYGVEAEKKMRQEQFKALDKISVILMLAFAEYVIKTKIGMKELFKEEGNAVKSSAFFDVLRGIGINIEENEHPNLKQFLCYSDMNLDLFSLSKLEAIVKQFETNEELREFAHKCYEELMNEERPITEEKEEQLTESNNLP